MKTDFLPCWGLCEGVEAVARLGAEKQLQKTQLSELVEPIAKIQS